jgi:diphthamide synthase (EF-2-diphthine--ammonia ligase)
MMLCRRHGHEVVALANLCPAAGAPDELDSFMFQTVGHQLVAAFAACAELPLFRRRIRGASRHTARAQRCRHPSTGARSQGKKWGVRSCSGYEKFVCKLSQ